jgi:hypothetical protein
MLELIDCKVGLEMDKLIPKNHPLNPFKSYEWNFRSILSAATDKDKVRDRLNDFSEQHLGRPLEALPGKV